MTEGVYHYHKPVRRPLSRKQRLWAVEYLALGNASQAAVHAGYGSHKRGWENMEKRVHEAFLEELGDTSGALDAVSPDALFSKLMKAIETAEQEGTKMRGLELAMRAKGMFKDSLDISVTKDDTEKMLKRLKALDPALHAMMAERMGATEH